MMTVSYTHLDVYKRQPQSEGNQQVFEPLKQEPEVEFAEQFTKLQGKFIYCINPVSYTHLAKRLRSMLQKPGCLFSVLPLLFFYTNWPGKY